MIFIIFLLNRWMLLGRTSIIVNGFNQNIIHALNLFVYFCQSFNAKWNTLFYNSFGLADMSLSLPCFISVDTKNCYPYDLAHEMFHLVQLYI